MSTLYSPKIVTNGLVLYLDAGNRKSYPGSGTTWVDLSGNNNTALLINGPSFTGSNSGFLQFDGTNDYATASNATSINSFGTGMTINIWAQINAGFVDTDALITKTNAVGSNGWSLYYQTNFIKFYVNSFTNAVSSSFTVADTRPNYWTALYNGANVILYKNGVLDRVGPALTAPVSNSNGAMNIAGSATSATPMNIYHIQIYNRALSATEILQNYNATRSRFGV